MTGSRIAHLISEFLESVENPEKKTERPYHEQVHKYADNILQSSKSS